MNAPTTKPKPAQTVENVPDELTVSNATLAGAMALAFAEIEAATKGAENPAFKQGGKVSKYANLGAVIDAIKPALINHRLFFTQHCHPDPDGVSVETVLHHASGESLSLGTLYVPANKKDPQGFGSALTYARRYGLQTAFVVPTEDDDGNAAVASMQNGSAKNGVIDEHQWATLTQLSQAARVGAERLCKFFEVDNLKLLPAAKYQQAEEMLKNTITQNEAKKQAKEPANA